MPQHRWCPYQVVDELSRIPSLDLHLKDGGCLLQGRNIAKTGQKCLKVILVGIEVLRWVIHTWWSTRISSLLNTPIKSQIWKLHLEGGGCSKISWILGWKMSKEGRWVDREAFKVRPCIPGHKCVFSLPQMPQNDLSTSWGLGLLTEGQKHPENGVEKYLKSWY